MNNRISGRRAFLKTSAVATTAAIAPVHGKAQQKKRKPNVIFIITDDQKLGDFGFIGGQALTPHIDKLAGNSMYFGRGYVSTSVCTPSRYTCLTGQYASRSKAETFLNSTSVEGQTKIGWNTNMGDGEETVASVLQQQGYATGFVGKWHLSGPKPEKVDIESDPTDPRVAKILRNNQEQLCRHIRSFGFDYAAHVHWGNLKNYPCRALGQHNLEWTVDGALAFMEQHKDEPFYLYFSTSLQHGPDRVESLNADPRITEAGLLDVPPDVMPSRSSVLARVNKAGLDEKQAPPTWLDDGVGALMQKLDDLNLTEDTLVIYFNDHGMEGGKGSLYEGGIRTPMFMHWPDVVKPGKSNALVQNIDFVQTIFDACDVEPPGTLQPDGISLLPLLRVEVSNVRDSVYSEIGHTRAVTTDRWKYLAFRIPPSAELTLGQRQKILDGYAERKKSSDALESSFVNDVNLPITHIGEIPGGNGTERGAALKYYPNHYYDADQLYDLQEDPREEHNLVGEPQYQEVLSEMKKLLTGHLERVPGTFGEFKQ
jgi:arylsulfatase A-like enzyme